MDALLRNEWTSSLLEMQDVFNYASIRFFRQRGLRAAYLPITTHSISSPMAPGSDSTAVEIDLFGVRTYLADSMQFLLEYACRFHPQGVYYVLPSFRGEATDDRHLSQFFHAEAEVAGTLEDVLSLVEGYVRALVQAFLAEIGEECLGQPELLRQVADGTRAFAHISVDDAHSLLATLPGAVTVRDDVKVLSPAGEQALLREFGGGPLWLVGHDASAVPFYQARSPDDPCRTRSADLLVGIGETAGAGERHRTAEATRAALALQGLEPDEYEWYLQMKQGAPLQTAGFGLGVERFLLWITGHSDIRDMQVVPRANGHRFTP